MRADPTRGDDRDARARVLVAEDDSELRSLLRMKLEEEGYRVVDVSDGQALRRRLEGAPPHQADLDAVISDIRLPGCSGLQVLELLRERDWALPVVLITAFADQDLREEARRLGAVEVLAKPFDMARLQSLLHTIAPPMP